DLDLVGAHLARGNLHDRFGAQLAPRVDVDRVFEAVHASGRFVVRDHVEQTGQLEVTPDHAAYDHVFVVGTERRQDRDTRQLFDRAARDDHLTQNALVGGGGRGSVGGGRGGNGERRDREQQL